jgi:RHS repeat-associated protein
MSDNRKAIADIETKTFENGSSIQNPVSNIRFQYDNHLGSANLELDTNAAIISYEEYHPFGTTSYRSGRTQTEVSLKRYKYVGKERDEETGLYYYGARYYAGWIARFVSVDPLQHKYPHYTPYQYAGNKPISYIDLDGLEEAKTPDTIQTNTTKTINQVNGEVTSKTMTKSTITATKDGSVSLSTESGTQYFTNGSPNGNYSYEFKTFEFSSPQQQGIGYEGVSADNTNIVRPTFNYDIAKPNQFPQPLGNINTEQLPQTSIGPDNPMGWGEDFLEQNRTQWENKNILDQAKQNMSQLHPISFGGPGFGIGAVPALHEGIRQAPLSIIAPEIIGAKILSKSKILMSYKIFATKNRGVFLGKNHNQLRSVAYTNYKEQISSWNSLMKNTSRTVTSISIMDDLYNLIPIKIDTIK